MPDEGHFIKSRHKYSRWLWLCSACASVSIPRQHRQGEESHHEKIVREALRITCSKFDIRAEFPLGPYYFDFAIPELRLLLEIDPHSTHGSVSRKIRDSKKSKLAKDGGWQLVRLSPVSRRQLQRAAVQAVWKRYYEFDPAAKPVKPGQPRQTDQCPLDRWIGIWQRGFRDIFHMDARLHDGDVRAAEGFLRANPSVNIRQLVDLIYGAWRRARKNPKKYPACQAATSMQYFIEHIREVLSEVGRIQIKGLDRLHD